MHRGAIQGRVRSVHRFIWRRNYDIFNLVLRNRRLEEVLRAANRVTGIRVRDRDSQAITELRGGIFIDASYEGDLAAYAGAASRVGRESRAEFNELHAGVVYLDPKTRSFLCTSLRREGPT